MVVVFAGAPNPLASKVEALVRVYRAQGASAAQQAYRDMCADAKTWEARAVRVAFQAAILAGEGAP